MGYRIKERCGRRLRVVDSFGDEYDVWQAAADPSMVVVLPSEETQRAGRSVLVDPDLLARVRDEGVDWWKPAPGVGDRVRITGTSFGTVVHVEPGVTDSHVVRHDNRTMYVWRPDDLTVVEGS